MADVAGQNLAEAGQGPVLLYLSKSGATKAGSILARDFRVLTIAPDAAKRLVDGFGGAEKFSIIAQGEAAEQAVALAVAFPDRVEAIALIAPPALDDAGVAALAKRWSETKVAVMALFGTKDGASPPPSGRAYRRAIANCNLMFVYDAGAGMDDERPEAVAALLRDFMVSKDRFVVSRESGVIHP